VIERNGEPVADGWTTHACVDARTLRPTRMPTRLKQELARAESASAPSSAESAS
jgi:acyl-CoA thioesterase FadM